VIGEGPTPEDAGPSRAPEAAPPVAKGTITPGTSKFALNTLIVFAVSVIGQFLGWVATHEFYVQDIAKTLAAGSATDLAFLGTATLYLLISSTIYTLGDLRFVSAYCFFVARGGDAGSLTAAYLLFRVCSLGVLALGFVLLAPILAPGLGISLVGGGLTLALFLIVPLLETPTYVFSYRMAAQGKAGAGNWPLLLENGVRTPLLVLVAFMFTWNPAAAHGSVSVLGLHFAIHLTGTAFVTDIGWAYVIGALVPFVAIAVHSLLSPQGLYRGLNFGPYRAELASMGIFAAPLVGAMCLTYAVSSVPPFLVAIFLTTAALQSFASANAFLLLLMFLPNAITIPLFPDMAGLFVRGELQELRRRTRKSMRWSVLILAPAILAVIVFRKVLLNDLYSSAVTTPPFDAEYALALMAISVIPQSLFRVMGSVLDAIGQQKRELYLSAVQLSVLFVSLILFLDPRSPLTRFGTSTVTGAALAVLLSTTAGFLSNAWFLHKYVRVHPSPRPYFTILGISALTFLLFSTTAVSAFGSLFGDPSLAIPVSKVWVLVVTVAVGTVVYFLLLAAVGELTKEDVLEMGGSLGLPAVIPRTLARLCWRKAWPGDEDAADTTPLPV
jgi:O-antigen/teichoic acid export membrane protein